MSQGTERGTETNVLAAIADLLASSDLACHAVFVCRKKVTAAAARDRRHHFGLVGMNLKDRAYHEIVDRYQKFVKERVDWRAILVEKNDDGGEPPDESYYVEATSGVPFHKEHLAEPGKDGVSGLDKSLTPEIFAIQFRFSADKNEAVFIKKFTPGRVFRYEGRTMFKIATGYIDVEEDDVVELPEGCDCCVFGDETLIFERARYENLFDHHSRNEAIHRQVFDHFRTNSDFEIVGIDTLESQTLNDPSKLRRFPAIVRRGIWNKPFAELQEFLNDRQIENIIATTDPNRIQFKTPYAMIHFFNDAHLDSKATGQQYLASTKTEEGGERN